MFFTAKEAEDAEETPAAVVCPPEDFPALALRRDDGGPGAMSPRVGNSSRSTTTGPLTVHRTREFEIVMYNVSPDGEESFAFHNRYERRL